MQFASDIGIDNSDNVKPGEQLEFSNTRSKANSVVVGTATGGVELEVKREIEEEPNTIISGRKSDVFEEDDTLEDGKSNGSDGSGAKSILGVDESNNLVVKTVSSEIG